MTASKVQAVLFDLDGTLIDSAPDLAGAANDMRIARGMDPLPLQQLRPMVGAGARGIIGRAFGALPDDERFAALRDEFLSRYEARLSRETYVFPQMQVVLDELDRRRLPWGIVTNKATRYCEPIVQALGLAARARVVICGDTTAHSKPHPEPLFEAARRMGLEASACAYVGDDLRDVQASLAAGMVAVAAAWGYLGVGESIEAWGAKHIIQSPHELLNRLEMA